MFDTVIINKSITRNTRGEQKIVFSSYLSRIKRAVDSIQNVDRKEDLTVSPSNDNKMKNPDRSGDYTQLSFFVKLAPRLCT